MIVSAELGVDIVAGIRPSLWCDQLSLQQPKNAYMTGRTAYLGALVVLVG